MTAVTVNGKAYFFGGSPYGDVNLQFDVLFAGSWYVPVSVYDTNANAWQYNATTVSISRVTDMMQTVHNLVFVGPGPDDETGGIALGTVDVFDFTDFVFQADNGTVSTTGSTSSTTGAADSTSENSSDHTVLIVDSIGSIFDYRCCYYCSSYKEKKLDMFEFFRSVII